MSRSIYFLITRRLADGFSHRLPLRRWAATWLRPQMLSGLSGVEFKRAWIQPMRLWPVLLVVTAIGEAAHAPVGLGADTNVPVATVATWPSVSQVPPDISDPLNPLPDLTVGNTLGETIDPPAANDPLLNPRLFAKLSPEPVKPPLIDPLEPAPSIAPGDSLISDSSGLFGGSGNGVSMDGLFDISGNNSSITATAAASFGGAGDFGSGSGGGNGGGGPADSVPVLIAAAPIPEPHVSIVPALGALLLWRPSRRNPVILQSPQS